MAAIFGMFAIFSIVMLAIYVIMAVATWKLFTKAGEAGWKGLVPIYNSWVFLRLGDQAGWWAVVALIPLVNIVSVVFMAIAAYNIGLKLSKEGWWVIIYLLLPIIWLLVLAFDKSTWKNNPTGVVPSPVDKPAFVPADSTTQRTDEPVATKPPIQL